MFRQWKKFRIVGKKPAVQKLPAQKTPKVTTSTFDEQLKKSRKQSLRTAYGTELPKSFYERPPMLSLAKERAEKVGRRVESSALNRIKKIRQATAKRVKARRTEFGTKKTQFFKRTNKGLTRTPFEKKVKTKMTRLQTKAFTLAEKRGKKAQARMEQKLGVALTQPKDRATSFYSKTQDVPGRARRETEFMKKLKRDMGF